MVESATDVLFDAAKNFDLMTTSSPFIAALMTARTGPTQMMGRSVAAPLLLMLARDAGAVTGRSVLGEVPGSEQVFGAVGTFWTPDIRWSDLPRDMFCRL